MAEKTEKKKSSFLIKLIVIVVVFIAGGVVGRTQVGWQAEKIYNTIRYSRIPIAEKFLTNPFALDIGYSQNLQGELETYLLLNGTDTGPLPIYEIDGAIQVGDFDHRKNGLTYELRENAGELLKDAKQGGSEALEKAKQLLELIP